ncbi:protein kinase domain-containing protein [Actinomadura parmotrematis]|uniref:non-specific serine/threonine protein kinase n=1 Tax=Actinomadura parmotrematis TaxID=2864039 RepID=A0ABS7FSC6_9ACTN|nr:protein kinase [Actinomadura parmotrematis]MBW8482423.1 protein kinase [Actinomadura parmotrematis]
MTEERGTGGPDGPGRVLSGRYELLGPIGRGGMGVVYRARDLPLDRLVAVKTLPAELTRSEGARARFQREARAMAALNHRGITHVHDLGEDTADDEPTPYLVMELVPGRTLGEEVGEGPLPPARAAAIAGAVLEALEHSHGKGVVHRDIKPSNIMVHGAGPRPDVKVMDFGIARLLSDAATRLTWTGALVGTPSYLSPEQAEGHPVDARSDLYSVGCVLYEMLTGRPPFVADIPTVVLLHHISRHPEPPSAHRPGLPPALDAVVLTALAKDPGQRFPDAAAMRRTLEQAAAGRPVPPPPTMPPPVTRPVPQQAPATVFQQPVPTPFPSAPIAPTHAAGRVPARSGTGPGPAARLLGLATGALAVVGWIAQSAVYLHDTSETSGVQTAVAVVSATLLMLLPGVLALVRGRAADAGAAALAVLLPFLAFRLRYLLTGTVDPAVLAWLAMTAASALALVLLLARGTFEARPKGGRRALGVVAAVPVALITLLAGARYGLWGSRYGLWTLLASLAAGSAAFTCARLRPVPATVTAWTAQAVFLVSAVALSVL